MIIGRAVVNNRLAEEDAVMRRFTKICKDCKFEEVVMVFTNDELRGNKVGTIEHTCKKCGSKNVEFKL